MKGAKGNNMKILIIIIIFITNYSFATGEKILLAYINEHKDSRLDCFVRNLLLSIHKSTVKCSIYYQPNGFVIELSVDDNKNKLIKVEDIGINTILLQIINQDKFKSDFFVTDSKIFNDEEPIKVFKMSENIDLILEYNRSLNAYLDNDYSVLVSVTINEDKDKHLLFIENDIFLFLNQVRLVFFNETEIKKLFIDNNASISNLDDIKKIYRSAYRLTNFAHSNDSCDYKNLLLLDKIHELFPLGNYPLTLRIYSKIMPKSVGHKIYIRNYRTGEQTVIFFCGWGFHEVSAYLNKDDNKIYILDPYFEKDGVIEYESWRKEINIADDGIIEIFKLNI